MTFTPTEQERIRTFRNWRALAAEYPYRFRVKLHRLGKGWAFSIDEYSRKKSFSNWLFYMDPPNGTQVVRGLGLEWTGNRPPFEWDIIGYSQLWIPPTTPKAPVVGFLVIGSGRGVGT